MPALAAKRTGREAAPHERVEHDRASDVRHDQDELEQCGELDLRVRARPGHVVRVVQHGTKQQQRRYRRCVGDEEQQSHPASEEAGTTGVSGMSWFMVRTPLSR
jgi:hypothetical protein